MLINLTNHSHNHWPAEQIAEAIRFFDKILDMPFPAIEPQWNKEEVENLAQKYVDDCVEMLPKSNRDAVHIMGEMTFTHHFVQRAKELGIKCVASTTKRIVSVTSQGEKVSAFQFVRFREY